MNTNQYHWSAFVEWLDGLPPDRKFNNGHGGSCVGHYFCVEVANMGNESHTIAEIDAVLPGFSKFFSTKIVHIRHHDGIHHASDILEAAKKFKP